MFDLTSARSPARPPLPPPPSLVLRQIINDDDVYRIREPTDRQTDGQFTHLPSFLLSFPRFFQYILRRASYKEAQCVPVPVPVSVPVPVPVPVRVADGCDCCMTPCSLVDITDSSEEYSVCGIKVAGLFETSVHPCHGLHIDNIEAHLTDQNIYNSLRGAILFDKLTVPQVVKKLPVLYYGT